MKVVVSILETTTQHGAVAGCFDYVECLTENRNKLIMAGLAKSVGGINGI